MYVLYRIYRSKQVPTLPKCFLRYSNYSRGDRSEASLMRMMRMTLMSWTTSVYSLHPPPPTSTYCILLVPLLCPVFITPQNLPDNFYLMATGKMCTINKMGTPNISSILFRYLTYQSGNPFKICHFWILNRIWQKGKTRISIENMKIPKKSQRKKIDITSFSQEMKK